MKKNKGGQVNSLIFFIGGCGEDDFIFAKEPCDVVLNRIDDVTFWNKQEGK